MTEFSLMLLNGGVGNRVAAGRPKQLVRVNGLPILVYSLVAADAVAEITQIVLNFPEGWRDDIEKIVSDYAVRTPITYVPAGRTRHDSVSLMLAHCRSDRVLIHESARPLVTAEDFAKLVAFEYDEASYVLPIPFTVAPVDPDSDRIAGSLDRSRLRNVQLPQKFRKATLVAAHRYAAERGLTFTEDATLCAQAGFDVRYLEGSDLNFKVTTGTDVRMAGFLARPMASHE